MYTREHNFMVANQVLSKVKAQILSSYDLMDMSKHQLCVEHDRMLGIIRNLFAVNGAAWKVGYNSPEQYLVTAEFGIGECYESSYYTAKELAKVGYGKKTYIIQVLSLGNSYEAWHFQHSFIIIGNASGLSNKPLAAFSKLSDDCVILDTKLDTVCQANQYLQNEKIKKYFDVYKFTHIADATKQSASQAVLGSIEKNIARIFGLALAALSPQEREDIQKIVKQNPLILEEEKSIINESDILAVSAALNHRFLSEEKTPLSLEKKKIQANNELHLKIQKLVNSLFETLAKESHTKWSKEISDKLIALSVDFDSDTRILSIPSSRVRSASTKISTDILPILSFTEDKLSLLINEISNSTYEILSNKIFQDLLFQYANEANIISSDHEKKKQQQRKLTLQDLKNKLSSRLSMTNSEFNNKDNLQYKLLILHQDIDTLKKAILKYCHLIPTINYLKELDAMIHLAKTAERRAWLLEMAFNKNRKKHSPTIQNIITRIRETNSDAVNDSIQRKAETRLTSLEQRAQEYSALIVQIKEYGYRVEIIQKLMSEAQTKAENALKAAERKLKKGKLPKLDAEDLSESDRANALDMLSAIEEKINQLNQEPKNQCADEKKYEIVKKEAPKKISPYEQKTISPSTVFYNPNKTHKTYNFAQLTRINERLAIQDDLIVLQNILADEFKPHTLTEYLVEKNGLLGACARLMEQVKNSAGKMITLFDPERARHFRNVIFHAFFQENNVSVLKKENERIKKMAHEFILFCNQASKAKPELEADIQSELFSEIMACTIPDPTEEECVSQLQKGEKELQQYALLRKENFNSGLIDLAEGLSQARLGAFAAYLRDFYPDSYKEIKSEYSEYILKGNIFRHGQLSKQAFAGYR
jgi:hypothetical protein